METLRLKLLYEHAEAPSRETSGSVGYDIKACLGQEIEIQPGHTEIIGSGFAIELTPGYAAFIYARSGLGINKGIAPANCVGVIDSDYRGEVKVGLRNSSNVSFVIKHGDRIAQMVIAKCELPEIELCGSLGDTTRGASGFGSSGVNG
jgi:dUTP pyrophosphatase